MPRDDLLQKMQYWRDYTTVPVDKSWLPPTRKDKYLVVDPDHGGFNNIRLAFEVKIVLALLTGRTLVMPENKPWYLLGSEKRNYGDFFDMADLLKLVPWITMDEFNSRQFKRRGGYHGIDLEPLFNAVGFPSIRAVTKATSHEVLSNFVSDRKLHEIVEGSPMWDSDVIKVDKVRLLGTWHTFVIFANPAHDLALKRLMRDHVHYSEHIWQLAAPAVRKMGGTAAYTSLHIRRGDFQYHEVKITAQQIFDNVLPLLKRSGKKKIYISTDEQDKNFFTPFTKAGYELWFWNDVKPANKVPYHLEGMLEQLMCASSNLFVGTRLSTFSSYIMRVRGYSKSMKNKEIFYCDRRYTGEAQQDGNEKLIDTTNTKMGGGELGYFREPQNVWVTQDQ